MAAPFLFTASALLVFSVLSAIAHWPSINNTVEVSGFADRLNLTSANVGRLKPICTNGLGHQTNFQTASVTVGGKIYTAIDFDTIAVDAALCAVKWRTTETHKAPGPLSVNRGATVVDGRVIHGGQDGRVLAYDAVTGKRPWATTNPNAAIGSGTVSYEVKGQQPIGVTVGMTSTIWPTRKVHGHLIVYGSDK